MDELESASRMMERKVLTQPLSTAGPMWVTASWARLLRLPEKEGGGRRRLQCSGWMGGSLLKESCGGLCVFGSRGRGRQKKRAKGSSDQFSAASCLSRYSGARLWREAWKISELGLDHTEINQSLPHLISTELGKKACTWFGEICSCSCLPVLPGPAGDLLSRICIPYYRALYYMNKMERGKYFL